MVVRRLVAVVLYLVLLLSACGPAAPSTKAGAGATDESTRFTVPENAVYRITDLVVQNPGGTFGLLTLENRDVVAPILSTGLENSRDLDFHFVTPIEILADDELFAKVVCTSPTGAPNTPCSANVLVSGVLITTG